MSKTIPAGSYIEPSTLAHLLEQTPSHLWGTVAPLPDIFQAIFSNCQKNQGCLTPKDSLTRRAIIWITSEKEIAAERVISLIELVYAKEISRVLVNGIESFQPLDLNTVAELIEAAILTGKNDLVKTKLLPWYISQKPIEKRFLIAALERGDKEMIAHLLELCPAWQKPIAFPIAVAIKNGCNQVVLKLIETNHEFLYAKDSAGLCAIHYAAEAKDTHLVDTLLFRYLVQGLYHMPCFLFPYNYKNYQFLLDRYLYLSDRILLASLPTESPEAEKLYGSFIKMHLNVILGINESKHPALASALSGISLLPIIIPLLVMIEDFCNTKLKYHQDPNDDPALQRKLFRTLRQLNDITQWLKCCEYSSENYHRVIAEVKSLKSAIEDYRIVTKQHARL